MAAVSILALTVGLSLARPSVGRFRVRPAQAAVLGAALMLGLGLLSPAGAFGALDVLALPLLTIASLMVITLVAEEAGLFRRAARWVAAVSRGDGRLLFRNLFLAGTATGAVFTNDAAVLIYTPLVVGLVEEMADDSWGPGSRLPFYFAVLYVANLVGPLVISNPINIIVADWFGIGFLEYALWMVLPALASIVVTYAGLRIFFRRSIPRRYRIPETATGPGGEDGAADTGFLRLTAAVMGLTLVGFFTEALTGLPTAAVALIGAAVLLVVHKRVGGGSARKILGGVGWDVLIFVTGIFLVAMGLREAGLTDALGALIVRAAESGSDVGVMVTGFLAGISSAVMNNHPVAQLMALTIGDLEQLPGATRRILAYAALIGGDLGPKMLPIGSLAALMWFRMLRDRGVKVSYWTYVAIGVPVSLAAILAALLVLNLEVALFG